MSYDEILQKYLDTSIVLQFGRQDFSDFFPVFNKNTNYPILQVNIINRHMRHHPIYDTTPLHEKY